jgi:uncharacterized protein YjbJ (UPF0337 family)
VRRSDSGAPRTGNHAKILIGKLQERYGYSREQAEQEIERWEVERKAS